MVVRSRCPRVTMLSVEVQHLTQRGSGCCAVALARFTVRIPEGQLEAQ